MPAYDLSIFTQSLLLYVALFLLHRLINFFANRKRSVLKSVDKYSVYSDSQARYPRLLGGENVGERGGWGDNLRRSEDTVGNRVFSQRLFPPARPK